VRQVGYLQELFLSDFNEIRFFFPTDFRKILISDFKKIGPVGAELFHADGRTYRRTDMTKLMVAFRCFTNAPNWVLVVGNICSVLAANTAMKYVILQGEVHGADFWFGIWLQIVEVLRSFQHSRTVLQQV